MKNYKVGDLIFSVAADKVQGVEPGWGGFAEFAFITDAEAMKRDGQETTATNNRILPPDLDPAAATMLLTWCEGYAFVKAMGVGKGAKVLILGSGGNGLAFAAAAKRLNAEFMAMSGNPTRQATAAALSVNAFVNYKVQPPDGGTQGSMPRRLRFCGRCVWRQGTLSDAPTLIRRGATVSVYGLDDGFDCILKPWFKPNFTWFGRKQGCERRHRRCDRIHAERQV